MSAEAEFGGIPNPAPARLSVGVVSAGRVGTALGEALERVGHVVSAVSAPSSRSAERAAGRLPEARIAAPSDIAARAELLVLAVPDTELDRLVVQLAPRTNPSAIVLHTSGAGGAGVLAPFAERGCTTVAFHPAMTFADSPEDTDRIAAACVGVTAADEVGFAVGQALAIELGAEPVRVAETRRPLYHAALAHGANHLQTVVADALAALTVALDDGAHQDSVGGPAEGLSERVLGPLARAALENALRSGPAALTGPAARGDADTVARHLAALAAVDTDIAAAYRAQSRRAASTSGNLSALDTVLKED
ncbi:DUF2520 domain-containing protein [Tsukamurella sp. 8F]|uniref:Rossmann-like and DUF2520 domain-containing protein n=1 Tax=unclassified Tsukamurella TaxID=2633480 RepID=UPI0023B8CE7D|nr:MULTISPECIES: DUF2520 domain-containing protein [unclassified Tsukamurella]MDF0530913.1 DUF2520 domain-containing protein [Tsukamurella sp. 8J]MDF0588238.1 DUF2520 domain-containing protein [Tsukamurella sp. 8F]